MIPLLLRVTGISSTARLLLVVLRVVLIVAIALVALASMGVEPLELAQQWLRDWLIPDNIL